MQALDLGYNKLVGITTDDAPSVAGIRSGLVGLIMGKMASLVLDQPYFYHCIIHQQNLCAKPLQMEHVMSVVKHAVNFIRPRGLKHHQYRSFLAEIESDYNNVVYYSEV